MQARSATRTLSLLAAFLSMAVVMVVKTFADTAFLTEYGAAYVPHFFVAQAVAMVTTAALYGRIIKHRAWVHVDALLLAITAGIAFAGPSATRAGGSAVFAIALALIALSALAALAVWNAATSIATGRAARAFIPRLGAAATLGAALGGLGSSAIIAALGVDALAPAAGAGACALLALQVILMRRTRADGARKPEARMIRKPASAPLARRLVSLLILATVFEALLSAFVDYGFKREVAASFERDQMGLFFAFFYGGGNALLLLVQLFIGSRLLGSKSLRFSLSLEPLGLLLAAALWIASPVLALAALGRGIEMIGKFGVARPAQEVALAPLRDASRQRWKVFLRGVFNQGAQALGGLLLIAAAPLLDEDLAIVPACIAGLALAWLLAQRRVANAYLDTLGSELGMLGLSVRADRGEFRLDRDGLSHVVELIAASDREVSRFGRDLLMSAEAESSVLASYLDHESPRVRRAVCHLLTRRPDRSCIAALRAAVQKEQDEIALANGLGALGALGDGAAIERARELVGDRVELAEISDPVAAALARAAWSYLAVAGALDGEPELLRAVHREMLQCDGVAAASLLSRAHSHHHLDGDAIDEAVIAAIDAPMREHQWQGLRAAAALGRERPLGRLLEALEAGVAGAEEALVHLDGAGLARLGKLIDARYHQRPGRAEPPSPRRLVRALGACASQDAVDAVAGFLRHPSAPVRELAAHTLLKLTRDGEHELPRGPIEEALRQELDHFEAYVAARPGRAERDSNAGFRHRKTELDARAFFLDELERRTERALTRVCGVLALQGNPAKVQAAERVLRALDQTSRRHGVDILQEVARGPHRTRLFELLEAYLEPRDGGEPARDRLCSRDPWLDRCRRSGMPQLRRRLWGLRATVLFDAVDGEALAALAAHLDEVDVTEGDIIVTQGEPGDALYVLMSGELSVEREGQAIARLRAGQCFGELALIDGKPRDATVVALERAQMLRLPRAPFQTALAEHPDLGLGLVRGLARWLRSSGA